MEKFSLSTYLNMMAIENSESFTCDIEKAFEQTNDNLGSLFEITMSYIEYCLSQDIYIEEVGDKVIRLSLQFAIRLV